MDIFTKYNYIYNFIFQYFNFLSIKDNIEEYASSDSEYEDSDYDYLSE